MRGVKSDEVIIELSTGDTYSVEDVAEVHYDIENKQYEIEHKDGGYMIINTEDRLECAVLGKDVKRSIY